jgi:hypothetical protein
VEQVVQIVGALLILAAFAASQFGWMAQHSYSYLWLNLIGSAVLAALAFRERQWGFLLLEGVWAVVSLLGLIARAHGQTPRPH